MGEWNMADVRRWPVFSRLFFTPTYQELMAIFGNYAHKKVFDLRQFAELVEQYQTDHQAVTHAVYISSDPESSIGKKWLLIRHDIDHDLSTAFRLARWEMERGLQTTYCVLHTAKYYEAARRDKSIARVFFKVLRTMQAWGHEINFHNNLVSAALRTGVPVSDLLEQELRWLRTHGLQITGLCNHGDRLCRELNYRNWEIFKECENLSFGGPRMITYDLDSSKRKVEVGHLEMADFGLVYEAYDIQRDTYITDSGGKLVVKTAQPGRNHFVAKRPREQVIGILTHPIWWNIR